MNHALIELEDTVLATDLYELTMAAAMLEAGAQDRLATFDLSVRGLPDERGYLIVAGLEQALAYLRDFRFSPEVLEYLADCGHFKRPFIDHLADLRFTGDVEAIPEGTAYFPPGPILRVTAPILQAQLVETYLLTTMTYQTMVASKAARVVEAADGRDVIDFSPRRDHGPQAGLLCARAAYIGGCIGSSNVLANRLFDIPMYGTMAHSFVMFYRDELEAFRAFAGSYPGNPTLLIDTYDTVEGARRALELLPELRAEGRDVGGVRLDSGDLGALSRRVREVLDEGGAEDTKVFASGNLDEYRIAELIASGAEIDGFGVGTELGTSGDAPSLNSTYKLVATREPDGAWEPTIKLSTSKVTLPGRKQIWRQRDAEGLFESDCIGLEDETPEGEPLLQPAMRGGRPTADPEPLPEIRDRAGEQRRAVPASVRALRRPAEYPVHTSDRLDAVIDRLRRTRP